MDYSTPGLPVHHQIPEFTQTHVHCISDAIQQSQTLLSPSPHTFNLSQHQGLFQWVSSLHQVAKVLELQLQHQSFQWNTQGWSPLGWTGWISLQYKRLSRVFFNTTIQKHQFFSAQFFFIVQISHPYMTTGKNIDLTRQTFVGKVMSLLFNMLSRLVMEKAMATHSSTLAWRIPGIGEPGRLPSMGSHRAGHDWSNLAVAAAT